MLDAVCYALYGGVPGARQGTRLRSDHAAAGTATEVVLELTVGGRRLEITRRPEQPRPKEARQRHHQEKAVSAAARADAGPPGVAGRSAASHQEIGEEISQLLGMSREQFCQVVLLPQGDFARFLRADAGDRAALLGRLFDTGRFAAVENWLADRRRAAEARVRTQDEALVALAHRMRQAAGPAAQEHPLPELTPGEAELAQNILEWAAVARSAAAECRDIAALALEGAEAVHRTAGRALEEARETARLQRQHAAARVRTAELDAVQPEFEQACRQLDQAHAADRVVPALHLRDTAARDLAEADRRWRAAAALLPADLTVAAPALLAERERAVRQDLGRLASARRAEQRAAVIAADRVRLDREAVADEDLERDTESWLADWEATRDACRSRLAQAQEAATTAERLTGQLEPAHRRLTAARRRDALTADERSEAERLLTARGRAADAQEHWLDLRERRLRGIAAELAAGLAPDAPCPVCGSAGHPDPARPTAGHVDRAAEEAAHEEYRGAEAARARADTALHTVRAHLDAATADAGDEPVDRLGWLAAALEQEQALARRTAADIHPAGEELRRAEEEHEHRLGLQRETQKRQAARVSERESLERESAALDGELAEVRGTGPDGVAGAARRLEELAGILGEAADAARTRDTADRDLGRAQERLAEEARAAGFTDPEGAARAVLGEERRRTLRRQVESHRTLRASVEAELTDDQLVAAAARPLADPEGHRAALEAATAALRAASAADTAAAQRRDELGRLSAEAAGQTRALAPLRAEYTRLRRLSQLTAGTSAENELRMRLESYVLAGRLEQVAAAASVRLKRMSSGRYTLVHTDAKASARGRSGLGLRVVDAWTGTERDTATLSGGETFFASLALALGLADVVTDEAGGRAARHALHRRGLRQPRRADPRRGARRPRLAARTRPHRRHRQPRRGPAPPHPRAVGGGQGPRRLGRTAPDGRRSQPLTGKGDQTGTPGGSSSYAQVPSRSATRVKPARASTACDGELAGSVEASTLATPGWPSAHADSSRTAAVAQPAPRAETDRS